MKILMIFQSAPLPPPLGMSSAKRNFPFFAGVIKHHDVSVLAYGTPGEEKIFREHYADACRHIRFIDNRRPRIVNVLKRIWYNASGKSLFYFMHSVKLQKAIDEAVASDRYDLIHCCMPMFGFHRFPKDIPLLTDTHNVEYDLVYRHMKETRNIILKLYFKWCYKLAIRDEIENLKKYDVILTTTECDRRLLQPNLPGKNIEVISNGVDSIFFEPQGVAKEPGTMIFMGSMSYYPNHHAISWFLDEIFPLIVSRAEGSHLLIVGPNPSPGLKRRASKNITVTGFVKDVRPYVAKSEVFIIPIRIGGGIRGKALEAMAMKIPIVTTTIGCEGIKLTKRESALFADTAGEFADSVVELFHQPSLRTRITERAYATVVKEYNWENKVKDLEKIYQSLAGSTSGKYPGTGVPGV